jgi:hypothetical protein
MPAVATSTIFGVRNGTLTGKMANEKFLVVIVSRDTIDMMNDINECRGAIFFPSLT